MVGLVFAPLQEGIGMMNITWYMPVFYRVALAAVGQGVIKHLASVNEPRAFARRFVLQFLFGAIIAVFVGVLIGGAWNLSTLSAIATIGALNAFAAYCQWSAIAINLSRTALFTFFDDILGMVLVFWILGEGSFLSTGSIIGIELSFVALVLFAIYRTRQGDVRERDSAALYLYIALYSVIWGVVIFLMRYWGAVKGVPIHQFLSAWYVGSFVGAALLFPAIVRIRNRKTQSVSSAESVRGELVWVLALGVFIVGSQWFTYWSYILASPLFVQPIFLLGEMIVPVIIGLYIFGEHKELSLFEWGLFALGIIGGYLIALSSNL